MPHAYSVLLSLLLFLNVASSKELSFSFDDAPMRKMVLYDAKQRTERLLIILKENQIQAVFFSITSNFSSENGLERMNMYDKGGHIIANHTHTHPNYDKTTFKDFKDDFEKAHAELAQFKNFKAWFRFPMLRHGDTLEKRDTMREHLKTRGYKEGYVTLDIQDWFMADLLNKALAKGKKMNEQNLCAAYADLIWDTISFYNSKAIELLNRSPKHTLLLHENDLAALCLETLIKKIKSKDWFIITPEIAMEDEIYKMRAQNLFSNNGQIASLYFEKKGIKLYDPWSHPWNDGELIKKEFERRKVFSD